MNPALRAIGFMVAGAAVAVGALHFATRPPVTPETAIAERMSEIEARSRAAQDVAISQFFRLQEFRRFGEEGSAVAWVVPVPEGAVDDPIRIGAAGAPVRVPRLAIDPGARDTWTREGERLASFRDTVDPRVIEAFDAVRSFAAGHPWPAAGGLRSLAASEWASPDVIETWLSLNRALVARVDALSSGG